MTRHLAALLLAGVALGSCRGTPPATAEAVAADRAAVDSATTAFHQALRTNDLDFSFMSYVAEDVFFMPPGSLPSWPGRRSSVDDKVSRADPTSSLTLADREVLVGAGWAVNSVPFEWAIQPTAGGSAVVDRGNYMQVWKQRSDKTWRFAREVYNSSVPPAPVAPK